MRLSQILFSQGFGSRRLCAGLIHHGEVKVHGEVVDDPDADFDPQGLQFEVAGKTWPYHEKALILLHKPAGYECSQKPRHHPSVMSLLPAPLRERGVQPVGRLDEDTTGLLLLTDDGSLIHKLTSPKHHVPKVYEAQCKHPVDEAQLQRLLAGVELHEHELKAHQEPQLVKALAAEAMGTHGVRLTLAEGKYHQVKRMLAAVSNRVERLHRPQFGALRLPAELPEGQWCWLPGPACILGTADGA